jgi:pimeloyl-ACP methyl ester carboxylesterase
MNLAVEKQDVEIDGLPIRYLAAGEGPPLVLLHGAGDSALDWRWIMPTLTATHRVYAPDLPGSPDSARSAANYSPAFFERFVATFVDALEIGPATFVGNSLGGLIALRLALSEPTRVTALVLVDSAGLGRAVNPCVHVRQRPRPQRGSDTLLEDPGRRLPEGLGADGAAIRASPRNCPARVVGGTVQAGALARLPGGTHDGAPHPGEPPRPTEVLVDRLPSLKIPTLVVWGARDRVFPESQAREVVAHLPEGSLAVIPDCGHMPHVECPDRFLAVLGGFIGGRARG